MSLLAARALLWRQHAYAARASFSPLLASLRWSSSGGSPHDGDDDIAKARKAAELAELLSRQREAVNRADKSKAEAAEAANRADKSKAEVDKSKAEAATEMENTRKAKAEADAAGENKWARRAAVGVLTLGAAYLAYDEFIHSKVFVRWRMKLILRAGPPDAALAPAVPESRRFALAEPMLVAGLPLLVLGPSGSGKSSLMAKMARDLKAKKVPVAYFSTRTAIEEKPNGQELSGGQALILVAHKFCEAVGYPERPSLLSQWKVKIATVNVPTGPAQVSVVYEAVNQFAAAISELFAVCAELRVEEGTVPFIVLDEFHDLMSERLRKVGGENLFALVANNALAYCLHREKVELIAAGSGSELATSLGELTKLRGNRVRIFFTDDPTEEAIAARFKAQGYSDATAQRIISSCGTRLRVLKPFLTPDSSLTEAQVAVELNNIKERAISSVRSLLRRAQVAEVSKELVAILDKLGKDELVVLADLPPVLLSAFPNDVLYQGDEERVMFQSHPVKNAWRELR